MKNIIANHPLQTLREEVLYSYTSSRTELNHGMLIVQGRVLSAKELEARWRRFTASNFFPPPLSRGFFRRNIRFKNVDVCIFGDIDKIELRRFESQATAIRSVAIDCLSSHGMDFGSIPRGLDGLTYLLYSLAWDLPARVSYSIKTYNCLDNLSDTDRSPFASREKFEAWEIRRLDISPGFYFANLSMDVRSCTVSAIDAILGLSPSKIAEPGKKTPVREKSIEDRDRWIYKKCHTTLIYKMILSQLKSHTKWKRIDSIQGIRNAARAYAKRHGLPDPPPRQS